MHVRARGKHPCYPRRSPVRDCEVPWLHRFADYKPVKFTHSSVKAQPPWADPVKLTETLIAKKRTIVGKRTKMSLTKAGCIHKGLPRNPKGRTGMEERGLLGLWGANCAADPIVTQKIGDSIYFVAVQRADTGEWALPGGMTEGKSVPDTLLTEFKEEALRMVEGNPLMTPQIEHAVEKLFSKGELVYNGYVDDPRNTDNAWIETTAVHFHIDTNIDLPLKGGTDARRCKWLLYTPELKLYANHKNWIDTVVNKLQYRSKTRNGGC